MQRGHGLLQGGPACDGDAGRGGACLLAPEQYALLQRGPFFFGKVPQHQEFIAFFPVELRPGERPVPLSVVGDEQKALGLPVQPAHRRQPGVVQLPEPVHHRGIAVVPPGGDTAEGLVKHIVMVHGAPPFRIPNYTSPGGGPQGRPAIS